MRWLSLVAMLAGCDVLFPLTPDPEPPVGVGFQRSVTINPPTSVPLSDFPVGILIDDGTLVGIDPDNMRFVDGGVELSSELLIDQATGAFEAWVRIPLLEESLTITFEWGGATVHETDPRTVWGEGVAPLFAGVWHLGEPSGPARDSANDPGGPYNVLDIAGSNAIGVPGRFGGARRYDGDDSMCAVQTESFQFDDRSFSFGVWVNTVPTATDFDAPLTKGGGNDGNPGFNFELGEGGWSANVCCDVTINAVHFRADTEAMNNRWVHLLAVVSSDEELASLRLFVDLLLVDTTALESAPGLWEGVTGPRPLCIGGSDAANETIFHGDIDEVRVYRGVVSSEWLATETFNLNNPEQFVTLGDPTPL